MLLSLFILIISWRYMCIYALRRHPQAVIKLRLHNNQADIKRLNGEQIISEIKSVSLMAQWLLINFSSPRSTVIIDKYSVDDPIYRRLRRELTLTQLSR